MNPHESREERLRTLRQALYNWGMGSKETAKILAKSVRSSREGNTEKKTPLSHLKSWLCRAHKALTSKFT